VIQEIRPYDFRRPEGLDRQAMATVKTIVDLAGRLMAARLGATVHSRVSFNVTALSQGDWGAFEHQVLDHGALLGFELGPYPAQVIYYLPHDLAMALVDLRLAGPGRRRYLERPLTDLERRVLAAPTEALCSAFADAVTSIAPNAALGKIHQVTGAQALQFTDANEQCVTATFAAHLAAGVEHELLCCAPVATLRPLLETIEARGTLRDATKRPHSAEIERLVSGAPTRIRLRFADVEASFATIEALGVGSVLSLNHPIDEPLVIESGGVELYRANRVQRGRRLAAQITELIDPTGASPTSEDEQGSPDE
jgi:flagellar motor switch protein FliM